MSSFAKDISGGVCYAQVC